MKVKSESKSPSVVSDSSQPHDYTVGILQARILEWVAFPFSRGSSQPRDWTQVSRIVGGFFTSWASREAQRILEWVAYPFSRGSSWPRNQTGVSCIVGKFFTTWLGKAPPDQKPWLIQILQKFLRLWITISPHPIRHLCTSPRSIWQCNFITFVVIFNLCWFDEWKVEFLSALFCLKACGSDYFLMYLSSSCAFSFVIFGTHIHKTSQRCWGYSMNQTGKIPACMKLIF